jgi:hypothetical protein
MGGVSPGIAENEAMESMNPNKVIDRNRFMVSTSSVASE